MARPANGCELVLSSRVAVKTTIVRRNVIAASIAKPWKGEMRGPKVRAAGRIVLSRDAGKLRFLNIQDWTGNIQLLVGKAQVGEANWALAECFDLGDIVGASGMLAYTKTGELSVKVANLRLLAKSLRPLPDKFHGLADVEQRYRQRYVDLIVTRESRRVFELRSAVIRHMRQWL